VGEERQPGGWRSRGSMERVRQRGLILLSKKEIALAGGIKAALDEAHSFASMRMTPRAMTAYEAVESAPTEGDGAEVMVQIVVRDEEELREAIGAGAEAVLLDGVSAEEARRLGEIARRLREDCVVEVLSVEAEGYV
jgi:nicotinate-nucleotide pyrophosphorylase (carboxylating)